jgi:hypothetical protein
MAKAKPPLVATASPHPFEKAWPNATRILKFWLAVLRLFAALVRRLWPYRRELLVLVVLLVTWATVGHLLPAVPAFLVGLILLGWPLFISRVRDAVLGWLACGHVRRLLVAGLEQTRSANPAGALPRIRSIRPTPVGERVHLRLRPGQSAELLDARMEELRAALHARDVRVTRDSSASHLVTVDVVRRDPLTPDLVVPWLHQQADVLSIWDPVHFGVSELGEPVWLPLGERAVLLAGNRGAGKSNGINVFVGHAAKSPDCELLLIDPNRIQLAPYRDRARLFADHDPDTAIAVVEAAQAELDRRLDWLMSLPGAPVALTRELSHEHRVPVWVLVVDELAYPMSVGGTPVQQKQFYNALRDVVARGRAAGIVVIAATQRPTHDLIPTSLRDLFDIRIAYRTMTTTSSDVILGDSFAKRGFSATDIDLTARGVNWLFADGRDPIRTKTTWISPESRVELAVTTVRHKPHPRPVSAGPNESRETR